MKNTKKLILGTLLLSLTTSVFAGGVTDELTGGDFIDNEVDSTIKQIDEAIVSNKDLTQYIFYFSQTCSHCQKVEKFFADNSIEDKFNIIKKDIGIFEASQEMINVRQAIGLDPYGGIPFLVYKENGEYKYIDGDQPIIDFFKKKLEEYYPTNTDNTEDSNLDNSDSTDLNTDISTPVKGDSAEDNDAQNQDTLLYFIIAGLVLLLGGGSFIILKKK